jgi:ketopantoate reductase
VKYLVVGSGALGSVFSACLSRAGCDVALVARRAVYIAANGGIVVRNHDGNEERTRNARLDVPQESTSIGGARENEHAPA